MTFILASYFAITGMLLLQEAKAATSYTYTILEVYYPPINDYAWHTVPFSINNLGQVAGAFEAPLVFRHGFVYSEGNYTILDVPNSKSGSTEAYGINDKGQVVGYFSDNDRNFHGFLYDLVSGSYQVFDYPYSQQNSGNFTEFFGINNSGQIVGRYRDAAVSSDIGCFIYDLDSGVYNVFPCSQYALLLDINNSNQVSGFYSDTSNTHGLVYDLITKKYTVIDHPNSLSWTITSGINDYGQVAGYYPDNSTGINFLYDSTSGVYTTLDALSISASATDINNSGQITLFTSFQLGYIATPDNPTPPTLIDPAPDFLDGPQITPAIEENPNNSLQPFLADVGKGREVQGVATDGVAQVIIRIPAKQVGEVFDVGIKPDQCADNTTTSDCIEDYGFVFDPSIPPSNLFSNAPSPNNPTIPVVAVPTDQGPMAFAAYRAPVDFVRPDSADAEDPQRSVFVDITSRATNLPQALEIVLVRPPVVLVHGLWAGDTAWDDFTGSEEFGKFTIKKAYYNQPVAIDAKKSFPQYDAKILANARMNSLGFAANAPLVLQQIRDFIDEFRMSPTMPVSAVQADIIAHSMGGLVTRTTTLETSFKNAITFSRGPIHKLITIGSPHLGSPLGKELLNDKNGSNACVRNLLAKQADAKDGASLSFDTVTIKGQSQALSGATKDLVADKNGGQASLSQALKNLQTAQIYIPTAMIVGQADPSQFAGLQNTFDLLNVNPTYIKWKCDASPLAQSLTPAGWPMIVGDASDGIVPTNSQSNGLAPSFLVDHVVHSKGAESLGLFGPHELEPEGNVPEKAVILLNTPVTQVNNGFVCLPSGSSWPCN